MIEITEVHNVSQAIRNAVAPVFLLTGIGSILNVVTSRLARAIDRARAIKHMTIAQRAKCKQELDIVVTRVRWLRRAIALLTLAALSVCVSIVSLFVSVKSGVNIPLVVMWSFVISMGSVILALIFFLGEILLTSREVIVESSVE